jgi:hypothetical protein
LTKSIGFGSDTVADEEQEQSRKQVREAVLIHSAPSVLVQMFRV